MGLCSLYHHTMPDFQEQGVTFKVISPDMHQDVMDFLWAHFFPEEPLTRSIGLSSERLSFIDKEIFGAVFQQNCSVAAVDSAGKILAVRVGIIKNRNSWREKFEDWMFKAFPYRLFSRFIPPSLHNIPIMIKMMKAIKFDAWKMFDVWNCPSIYEVKYNDKSSASSLFISTSMGGSVAIFIFLLEEVLQYITQYYRRRARNRYRCYGVVTLRDLYLYPIPIPIPGVAAVIPMNQGLLIEG